MRRRAAIVLPLLAVWACWVGYPARAAEPVILPLDGAWSFRIAPKDAAAHPSLRDWRPARVPGSIQADLLSAGLIPDPDRGLNEAAVQWVGLSDWEEQRDIDVPAALLLYPHVALVFDGLDTLAEVRVNDRLVLSADNQFRQWRIPVGSLLHAGRNRITVLLRSPIRSLAPWLAKQPFVLPGEFDSAFGDEPAGRQTAPYLRKAAFGYGWDWGPRIVTEGIWRSVRIEASDAIRLAGLRLVDDHVAADNALLHADATIDADHAGMVSVSVDLTPPGGGAPIAAEVTVPVATGETRVSVPIAVPSPALWFPAGYGTPSLYTAHVMVRAGGTLEAEATRRIGLRRVELRRDADRWGRGFALVVNGIPIFAKGANLIPFDMLPSRVTPARMRALLDDARAANMNMLRVWGGGSYLDDSFYDMADERGLMIWQDFMFGGSIAPPDVAFRENVRAEAEHQVRRLRDHPSIVLWCGNNEVETGWESWPDRLAFKESISPDQRERLVVGMTTLFGDVLRQVVESEAGVPYWATTPGTDLDGVANIPSDGDMHVWDVWSGAAKPADAYLDVTPRFQSEYGLQSMPDMRTIRFFASPGDLTAESPVMRAHQKYDRGNGNDRLLLYVRRAYGEPRDFESLVYLSQLMQADGIRIAAEHLRAQRPRAMGSLYWQINDVWPGITWSSVDYFGRRKMLQFRAAEFYAPVAFAAEQRDGHTTLNLVSDRTAPVHGTWRLRVMDMDGTVFVDRSAAVSLLPLSVTALLSDKDAAILGNHDPARTVAIAEFTDDDGKTARRTLLFAPAAKLSLPDPGLSVRVEGDKLIVSARRFARAVWIDSDVCLSDNGFDLLPGEQRTIATDGFDPRPGVRSLFGATIASVP